MWEKRDMGREGGREVKSTRRRKKCAEFVGILSPLKVIGYSPILLNLRFKLDAGNYLPDHKC
jgi:hypothetical protein